MYGFTLFDNKKFLIIKKIINASCQKAFYVLIFNQFFNLSLFPELEIESESYLNLSDFLSIKNNLYFI